MDLTELGDGTKRLFGGLEFMEGKGNVLGGVFGMLDNAREAEEDEERRQADEEAGRGRGLLSRLFGFGSKKVDFAVEDHAVQVTSVNNKSGLPENIYLVSSGGATIEADEVEEYAGMKTHEDRARITEALYRALKESDKTWRVFIDTDGDRRPNSLTKLGYLLADFCVLPIQADECDFQRVEQMLSVLGELRDRDQANCQVQLMMWNRVQVYNSETSAVGYYTPPKVAMHKAASSLKVKGAHTHPKAPISAKPDTTVVMPPVSAPDTMLDFPSADLLESGTQAEHASRSARCIWASIAARQGMVRGGQ